jgi:hypothetical protein
LRDVAPTKYQPSTQKDHRHVTEKHLLPRFGEEPVCDVTTPVIQTYVTHLINTGYAPKSIDHIHDLLSAIIRSAVKWGHLQTDPAHRVEMPQLKTVRPKWARPVPPVGAASTRRINACASTRRCTRGSLILRRPRRACALFPYRRWRSSSCAHGAAGLDERHQMTSSSTRSWGKPISPTNVLRTSYVSVAGLSVGGIASGDLADVPTDLFIVGARQGRAAESRDGDHGTQQGRHDTQRLHANSMERRGRPRHGSDPNWPQLATTPAGRRR